MWNKAHFFLSELSVSGGMPTTVTVPCSTFSGAAITKGSSLQRRFFVCGGKIHPHSRPHRVSAALSTQDPDGANCSLPKASRGLISPEERLKHGLLHLPFVLPVPSSTSFRS